MKSKIPTRTINSTSEDHADDQQRLSLAKWWLVKAFATVALVACIMSGSQAQDTTPPTSDLDKTKTEAETRKAIAEARKAEFDAKFPKASTSPLEGKTTTDGDFIEGQIIAYVNLTGAANRMATDLHVSYPGIQTLIVHNQRDITLLQNYYAGRNRIAMLITQYGTVTAAEAAAEAAAPNPMVPTPILRPAAEGSPRHDFLTAPLALGAATSTVGAFTDFLGAFRTDVNLTAKSVEVAEDALVAELFKALRSKYPGINLYYPSAIPPKVNALAPSVILTDIQNLYDARERAELKAASVSSVISKKQDQIAGLNQLINEAAGAFDEVKSHNDARITKIKDQIVDLEADPIANSAKIAALQAQIVLIQANTSVAYGNAVAAQAPRIPLITGLRGDIAALQASTKPLDDLNKQFDNLIKDLLKTDETGGISLISSYVQTENLINSLASPNSYFLAIGFVKGGGNQKIERNLIADVFRGGSKISYSGGVILKYNLFTPDGRSLLSDITKKYGKYISAKQVQALTQ